jgi:hypothetical protein
METRLRFRLARAIDWDLKTLAAASPMDKLQGEDLRLACRVVHDRYKQCMRSSLMNDVLVKLDVSAPTAKCGHLFADLSEHCAPFLRAGELQLPASSTAKAAAGATGAAPPER